MGLSRPKLLSSMFLLSHWEVLCCWHLIVESKAAAKHPLMQRIAPDIAGAEEDKLWFRFAKVQN